MTFRAKNSLPPAPVCVPRANLKYGVVRFQVRAWNKSGWGPWSKVRRFKVVKKVRPTTTRVSVRSNGAQGDGRSGAAFWDGSSLSGNGRYVAFHSSATNLVPGDTNVLDDVFVYDRGNESAPINSLSL